MAAQAQLPTEKQAMDAMSALGQEIHGPAFFEKLAAHGIQPQTAAEQAQLLQLGATLGDLYDRGQYKSAAEQRESAGNPFLTRALNRLQQVTQPAADFDTSLKQAAAGLLQQRPDLAAHAAVYHQAVTVGLAPSQG